MKYIEARSIALVELFITCNIICDMILVYQDYVMVFHQSERPRPYLRKKTYVCVGVIYERSYLSLLRSETSVCIHMQICVDDR